MENKILREIKEIYDPINQPVSYAVVHGLVPELRELIKTNTNIIRGAQIIRELTKDYDYKFKK